MVRWHHRLNGHELAQTPEDSEGWGAWRAAIHGAKELDTTQQLDNNNNTLLKKKKKRHSTYNREIIECQYCRVVCEVWLLMPKAQRILEGSKGMLGMYRESPSARRNDNS